MIRTLRAFDPLSIQLVIFDLDGTLIDSRLDLVHSVNAALRHIGRPELPEDIIASYVGDGAPILIKRALGGDEVDEATVRQGLEFFLKYYREHKLDHTTVYAGIAEALAAIQNSANGTPRKLAVLSNKPVVPRGRLWKLSAWGNSSRRFMAATASPQKSPIPRARASCSKSTACAPEQAVIVGDSHIDIETGHNAGMFTVGVTYGFAPHSLVDASPDVVVDHPTEIAAVFAQKN